MKRDGRKNVCLLNMRQSLQKMLRSKPRGEAPSSKSLRAEHHITPLRMFLLHDMHQWTTSQNAANPSSMVQSRQEDA